MYYLLFCNSTYLYLFTLMLPLLCQLQGLELHYMVYCSTVYACSNHFFDALDLNIAIKTLWWTIKNLIEHSLEKSEGKLFCLKHYNVFKNLSRGAYFLCPEGQHPLGLKKNLETIDFTDPGAKPT